MNVPTNRPTFPQSVIDILNAEEMTALGNVLDLFPGSPAEPTLVGEFVPDEPSILKAADEALAEDTAGIPRLGALTRSAALARIAARPTVWRVRDILTSDDYGVLAGPKGVGKTFALLDLSVGVSLGEPWFGRFETERSRVLVLTSEDSEARLWQRIDAIVLSHGRDLTDVDGWLFVHPLPFNAIQDIPLLKAELNATLPGLVIIDPAYKYLVGAQTSSLFDMGQALTPIQVTCSAAGASLLVGHHYNRREGAQREERIQGAGLLEWARVVITVEAKPRRDDNPAVDVMFEITGNSIDPITLNVRRSVIALQEGPSPEISYSVMVTDEGADAIARKFRTAADRVYSALEQGPENGKTIKQIGDACARDGSDKGLLGDTISKTLRRALSRGEVDTLTQASGSLWWRV